MSFMLAYVVGGEHPGYLGRRAGASPLVRVSSLLLRSGRYIRTEDAQMHRRPITLAIVTAVVLVGALGGIAQAGGPTRDRGSFTETFFDEFILDLCGIETFTTETQRWSVKEFDDGSATVHVVRTFVSEDPRLPIEKGAATTFFAPDGTRRVVGKPIQLIGPDGGVRILDAGWVELDEFDNPLRMRGPHPSLEADLALYYCPQG
jgi:hypothetical protein